MQKKKTDHKQIRKSLVLIDKQVIKVVQPDKNIFWFKSFGSFLQFNTQLVIQDTWIQFVINFVFDSLCSDAQ